MQIFIDLDGVLIDTSDRSYSVYATFLREAGYTPLNKPDYLACKRSKMPVEEILQKTGTKDRLADFIAEWNMHIETPEAIALDKLFPRTKEALEKLQKHSLITLLSLRKNDDLARKELADLGIREYFAHVHFGKEESARHEGKVTMIKHLAKPGDVMIGDSETDIRTAKPLSSGRSPFRAAGAHQSFSKLKSPIIWWQL